MNDRIFEMSDYYRVLFSGRWIIITSLLISVAATVYLNSRLEPVYQATTTIMVQSNGIQDNIFAQDAWELPDNIEDQLQLLKSRRLAIDVIKYIADSEYASQLRILGNDQVRFPLETSVRILQGSMVLKPVPNSNFIHITLTARSGFEAQFLANSVAEIFFRQNQTYSKSQYTDLKEFIQSQLDKVQAKLEAAEDSLRAFQEDNKVASLTTETSLLVQTVSDLNTQINSIRIDMRANDEELENLRTQYLKGKSTMVEDVSRMTNLVIERLLEQISEKQTRIANLQTKRDEPGSLEMIERLEEEIRQIKISLAEETRKIAESGIYSGDPIQNMQDLFNRIIDLEVETRTLKAREDALIAVTAVYEQKLENLPETSLILARLERDRELNAKIYTMLNEKYEETNILAAGTVGTVQIIDTAITPRFPIKPNKRLNLVLAVFFGLLIGLGISVLIFLLDSRVQTVEDLTRVGLKQVGVIPFIDSQKIDRKLKTMKGDLDTLEEQRVAAKLITHFAPRSPISEAYRTLRTNVMYYNDDVPTQVLLVTSSGVQEGKTLTCANMAVVFAQTGEKVLVIDADMRRPSIHRVFQLNRKIGLSNVLSGNSTTDVAIIPTDIPNLSILPAGEIPANPSELVASPRMRELVSQFRQEYDRIIIDAPPVVAVTDPAILSRIVDGLIMVVASGKVHRRELKNALGHLENVRANILGSVLNSLDIRRIYGPYYYYYRYYNYYYYYGADRKKMKRKMRERRKSGEI